MVKRRFAKGKHAYSYSERSGLKFPYNEMIHEPGTDLWIHKSESDGMYNEVDHPQNFTAKDIGENPSLENVFGDDYDGVESEQVAVEDSEWLNKIRPPYLES